MFFAFKEVVINGGTLVHGMVTNPWDKHKFWHAWVEKGGQMTDWQRQQGARPVDQGPWVAKSWFYKVWKPTRIKRYTAKQAADKRRKYHHVGPWGAK